MSTAHRYRWLVAAGAALYFAFSGVWLWSMGSLVLLPAFALVVGLWVVGGLVIGVRWAWINVLLPFGRTTVRLGGISWKAIVADPAGRHLHAGVQRSTARMRPLQPIGVWFWRRLRPGRGGLRRTAALAILVIATVALWKLSTLVADPASAVNATDHRIADMAARLNESGGRTLMIALTEAGRTPVMSAIVVLLAVGALLAPARRSALLLVAITAGSALAVTVLKATVDRARPGLGQLTETSASWPSGHASAGLALALAVAVAWHAAGRRRWSVVAAVLVPVGMLIGYSRAYLVVHWSSDVLAGWLVAVAVTSLVVAVDDIVVSLPRGVCAERHRRWPVTAGVLAVAVFVVAGFLGHTAQLPTLQEPVPLALGTNDPTAALESISVFSETITGREMEPIGLVIAASDKTIHDAISAAGWSVADAPTTRRLLEVYWAGFRGQDDLTAPVTPTFLGERMQDIAIERPTGEIGGVKERHHARIWRLDVTTRDGCPIWVATASLDDGVEWTWRTVLPNHHINPAIDQEQATLVGDLTGTGYLVQSGTTRVTEPMLGTNAAGDPWFTEGTATVLTSRQGCRG